MTNMERLQQIAEASKVRDLTEEEKAEVGAYFQPVALTIAEAFEAMSKVAEGLAAGLRVVNEHWKAFAARFSTNAMLSQCPNKRVVHLAKHGRKWRTRKKNLHRAARIVKKEATK